MRAALAALLLCACGRGPDSTVRAEYEARLGTPPAPGVCADAEARRAHLAPLLALVADAYAARQQFDEPLPETIRLDRVSLLGVADDFRCLRDAGRGDPSLLLVQGTLAALEVDRAGELLALGDETGWGHVAEAFRLYGKPPAMGYIYALGFSYFIRRARTLLDRYPAPAEVRSMLADGARVAAMPRAVFCAGLREEFLAMGSSLFHGHLEPLRGRFVERWGPSIATVYDAANLPQRATWDAWRDLFDAVTGGCEREDLVLLLGRAQGPLRRLPAGWQRVIQVTLDRLQHWQVRELGVAGFPR